MPRRVNGQQVKESFCLDIIVFNECLYRIFVLLTTDMLVSRKIRHNVKAFLLTEDPFKDRIGKVQGICPIFRRYIHAVCGTQVTCQFCQSVLVQVYYNQFGGLERQDCFNERRTDGTGTSYDAYTFIPYFCLKRFFISFNICCKHTCRTTNHMVCNELL